MESQNKKRLWQQIVIRKIENQSACLRFLNLEGAEELLKMSKNRYNPVIKQMLKQRRSLFIFAGYMVWDFPEVMIISLTQRLNYGYAIVRGMIARSIICYGLEPSLGLFHSSELNSYNLADDFIEVFRPVVDLHVSGRFDISEVDRALTP